MKAVCSPLCKTGKGLLPDQEVYGEQGRACRRADCRASFYFNGAPRRVLKLHTDSACLNFESNLGRCSWSNLTGKAQVLFYPVKPFAGCVCTIKVIGDSHTQRVPLLSVPIPTNGIYGDCPHSHHHTHDVCFVEKIQEVLLFSIAAFPRHSHRHNHPVPGPFCCHKISALAL